MKVGQNYNIMYHKLTFDPGAAVVLLLDYLCIFMRGKAFYQKVPILVLAATAVKSL